MHQPFFLLLLSDWRQVTDFGCWFLSSLTLPGHPGVSIYTLTLMTSGSVPLSVQFNNSVMSNSLRLHESQHARPPCPSPTPGVHSDSRPSSQWCHPASVRSLLFLPFFEPIFARSVPLVSLIFFEEISSLSHSIVFLYFFALIAEEGFLISPCYSLEVCTQMGIPFLFSFAFCFPSFYSYF